MRNLFWLKLLLGLAAGSLSAGTIQFGLTPLGGNSYQENFTVSGITFQANQELDIRFDPSLYGVLSHGLAPSGFDVTLLQPNNPPGVFGDDSIMAQVNNPSTAGPFSVQFTFIGPGQPGALPFFLNQFNSDGFFVSTINSGSTSSGLNQVPEPSSLTLIGAALLLGGLLAVRQRLHKPRQQSRHVGQAVSPVQRFRLSRYDLSR